MSDDPELQYYPYCLESPELDEAEAVTSQMERDINQPPSWENVVYHITIPTMRTGWRGLWGHFKALIMRRQPDLVPTKYTLSFWVKRGTVLSARLVAEDEPTPYIPRKENNDE